LSIANDSRVIFIKLADRLHNIRTLESLPREKQVRIAKETIEIYAPIASRLGFSQIKIELEDLCFKYLYPDDYYELSNQLEIKRKESMAMVNRIIDRLSAELIASHIKADIKGRPKHLYSIYKKMKNQGKTLDEIYDLIAIRVIVETESQCYTVLGIIHSLWKPIPGRFKDYISMPKPNQYQSLHTTVISNFGQVFEIQIRTIEMNRVAEYGLAAHWKYKENKENIKFSEHDKHIGWIQEMVESENEIKDSAEFLAALKTNILPNEIFVFTPKGDVIDLPLDSTPLDFAYRIHSEIGNSCVGAKINGKLVPLNTTLKTGDVIEILTQKNAKGPSRDWLKIVKSSQAKSKIKAFFKKIQQEDNIKLGRDILEREAKRRGYNLSDLISIKESLQNLNERYSITSLDEMYASVGHGSLTSNQIITKLIDRYVKHQYVANPQPAFETSQDKKRKNISNILIEGYDGFLVKLSKCCNPLPGDLIVGYASRGTGVSIHRIDCPNIKNMEKERLLEAKWADSQNATQLYTAYLKMECEDRAGLVNSFIPLLAAKGVSISSLEIHKKPMNKTHISLGLEIKEAAELESIIQKLSELPEVISVRRGV
jgi:GTP pyrophosphokinase